MTLRISLLGQPHAVRDGAVVGGVRGAKTWALLAYLLLSPGPVERRRLAMLLCPDAADPAAALRWNLSQLRRGLGVTLEGDPVRVSLPPDSLVDLQVLAQGEITDALAVPGLGRELLEGVTLDELESFTIWLEGERRHLSSLTADVLREAAVQRLSQGDADAAVVLAERVLELDPFDENAAVLLVRSLREAGRPGDAIAVADSTAARIRKDLGMEPSSMLWSAAHTSTGGAARIGGTAAVEAQLEAGEAALAAGVPDAGLDALRGALGGSRATGDPALLSRCLTALGSGLIHAVRGSDQDGLSLLHEAIPLAVSAGLPRVAARATRELGYVDLLRGRYERAHRWFGAAAEHATGDDEELGWIAGFAGAAHTDVGDYASAAALLDEAVGRAAVGGSSTSAAMAHTWRGRLRLFTDDVSGALEDLDRSVEIARSIAWRSYLPWPQTMRAEIAYRRGDLDGASSILSPALATSLQVGDPCWEAMALRGLGLTGVARGDISEGLTLLEQAPRRCRRLPDTYLWVEVYGLDALADVTSGRGLPEAETWLQRLEEVSTSHGMQALRRNAAEYRQR